MSGAPVDRRRHAPPAEARSAAGILQWVAHETAVPTRFTYQPALDGMRAIAVSAVLIFHGYSNTSARRWGSGGFLGVDLFFVLSGYLITSQLVIEHARSGRISLRQFWARRVRRLLPALVAMVGLAALYASETSSRMRTATRGDALFTMLNVQNWHVIWSHETLWTPFGATWSLSIEEQWYLVWPVVLVLAMRLTNRRTKHIGIAVAGLAVASAISMTLVFSPTSVIRAYYGTDTRAQGLLVGAAFALLASGAATLERPEIRRRLDLITWLGASFIAYEILRGRDTDAFLYHGGFLLFAVAAGFVVLAATAGDGAVRRVLSVKPLVALGLISYGVYLYHVPVFLLLGPGRVHATGWLLFAVRVVCTVALATISHRFLERPIRDRWRLVGERAPAAPVARV